VLDGVVGARLFSNLVATGRAFLAHRGEYVKLSEGAHVKGELTFESDADGGQRPAISLAPPAMLLPLSPAYYVDPSTGAAGPIDVTGVPDDFVHAWIRGGRVAPAAAASLARRLASARLPVPAPAPRVRRIREIDAAPTMILRLESELPVRPGTSPGPTRPAPDRPWVRVFFDYADERVDPGDVERKGRMTDDEIVTVRRRHDQENVLNASLDDAGLIPVQRAFSGREMPPGLSLAIPKLSPFAFAPRIAELASPSVRIEKAQGYAFDVVVADDLDMGLEDLPDSLDQFGVSLGLRVGDETFAALPLVLAALRERLPAEDESLLVTLPDGRAALVPAARLLPLRQLLIELLGVRDPNRVSRVRALALDPAVLSRSPESLAKLRTALTSTRVPAGRLHVADGASTRPPRRRARG
jgi:hypothetical protein